MIFSSQARTMIVAFSVAPAGPALWGAAWAIVVAPNDIAGPVGFAVVFYMVSFPIGVILGVPALILLARLKILAVWSSAVIAALAGVVIALAMRLPMALYSPIGPIWAIVFYLIWRMGPEPTDAAVSKIFRRGSRAAL